MRHDLARLKELNSRLKPEATSLVVPIVPTVSMMLAAADFTDVFIPGDRMGDWLLPESEIAEEGELADPGLVARFGSRKAYELQVMSEIWAGCISGLREWSRKRGIEGCNPMVDGWFRPQIDTCPPSGWPADRAGVDDEHRRHLSALHDQPPFLHSDLWMPHSDLSYVMPAPPRCAAIMAMRAGQREFLMEYYLLGLDDVIDMERLPFIPGYTIEHRFDDEERHRILAAAAWRAAAAVVHSLNDDDEQMPLPPKAASVYLSRLGSYVPRSTANIPNYFRDAPYHGLTFAAGAARLELKARGTALAATFDRGDGTGFCVRGMDFRLPGTGEQLVSTIREMASGGPIELSLPDNT